jgi:hypothetical protein
VSDHLCWILQACIQKCDKIEQDLLDILLTPLLPSPQFTNPASYKNVVRILRKTSVCIQASISAFINHVLMGTALRGKVKTTKLANDTYPLLIELHEINPELLQRLSPSICVQLRAEKEEIDLTAVISLKRLFSSKLVDSNTEFSKDFRDLLGRFNNLSNVVQLAKDDSVNSMPSSHNDHDGDVCDTPVDISTKVISTMNVSEVPTISTTAALSTGADVSEAIEPSWDILSPDCSFPPDDDNDGRLRTGHEYASLESRRDLFIEDTYYPSASLFSPTPSLRTKRQSNREKRAAESTTESYCKDNRKNLFQTSPDFTHVDFTR